MARWEGDAAALRVVVRFLRAHSRMTPMEFAEKSGVDPADISRYERGEEAPSEQALRRMTAAADLEWTRVAQLCRFNKAVLAALAREVTFEDPDPELERAILDIVLLAVTPFLIEKSEHEPFRQSPEEARQEAEEVWTNLQRFSIAERRRLLGFSLRASRNWALAIKACLASEQSAAHSAKEALDLAELALSIAERVEGEEGFRNALMGLCWGFLGNAHRAANDFDAADDAFARAADLERAGADPEELLPTWRLFDLEASLRRAQHRISDALALEAKAILRQKPEGMARQVIRGIEKARRGRRPAPGRS